MKIGIVTIKQLYSSPNIGRYYKLFGSKIEIIHLDRLIIGEKFKDIKVLKPSITKRDYIGKNIINLIIFRKFVKKTIESQEYDRLIIFPTQTAIILWGVLAKFKSKYVYEIHDYSYEKNLIFKFIQKQLIKNSEFTFITSKKYINFLPKHNYYIIHNFYPPNIPKPNAKNLFKKNTFNISFIGVLKFDSNFIDFIDKFANHTNFTISFIGQGSNRLKTYCEDKKITNVKLIDRFDSQKTFKYYIESDIILNTYGTDNLKTVFALSNKLYLSAFFYKPIIVSDNTYMSELVNKFGLGFVYDKKDFNCSQNLLMYIKSIDINAFKKKADIFLKMVKEDQYYADKIIDYYRKWIWYS